MAHLPPAPRIVQRAFLLLLLVAALPLATTAQYLMSPQPGDVYKEFMRTMSGDDWRVTDPNINLDVYPQAGAFLPNPTLDLDVDDLSGAVRAEAIVNIWGGHVGTAGKKIRFNGNGWIDIPELGGGNGIPDGHDGFNYISQMDLTIPVPLSDLHTGTNTFQGTNTGQTGPYGFGWGQFGWYSIILRVYYDNGKTHSTGSITSPSGSGTMGENPMISASVSGGTDRVDFLAYYDGYDTDGDGVWQEYHHDSRRRLAANAEPTIKNHVGTVTGGGWQTVWDTRYVPDQAPGSIKLVARIRNGNGVWYVSPEVSGLTLQRSGSYVRLYKPLDMPERAWARGDLDEVNVHYNVTDDVSQATEVVGMVRTWNGIDGAQEPGDYNYRRFNGWTDGEYGGNHAYAFNIRSYPTGDLQSGTNSITFFSSNILHHGIEILWPGPGLIVRYGGSAGNFGPSISSHPANRSVAVGATASFSVGASGTAPLRYQWQKNDADIDGATGSSYTTPATSSGDNGATFRCVVTNDYGTATSNRATLTVGSGTTSPVIDKEPTDQTVIVGATATFTVQASGTAPLTYKWQKNSADIDGATEPSYTTPPVSKADSGALFRCIVSNGGGDTPSAAARLIVVSSAAPTILFDPVDQLVGVGQPATFTVRVQGAPPISFQWKKNGAPINGATDSVYTTPATSLVDSGSVYQCVVKNTLDSTFSAEAKLKVTTGSVSVLANAGFEQGTASWAFYTNGSATFTAAPAGPRNPHAGRVAVATEGSNVQLYQTGVTLEAGAQYRLYFRAYSTSGHDVSVSIQKHASPFTSYGVSGQVITLDTTWKDHSVTFTASGFAGVATDARMMFYLAPYDSAGDVFSFDDVSLSKVSSVAPLAVTGHPASASITVGDTAVFIAAVSGTPPITYQWQKNTVDIFGADGPRYVIPPAGSGDNGAQYRCVIKNPAGTIQTNSATLTVNGPVVIGAPVLLLPLNGSVSAATTQNFVWNRGVAGVTKYWFEIATDSLFTAGRSVDSSLTDTTKNVSGLTLASTYYWRVRAGNAGGWGPLSSTWRVRISLTSVAENRTTPTTVTLDQNYPNPFNPSTTIRYSLPAKASVQLKVFNLLGVEVAELANGEQEAGYHEIRFNAESLPSGMYFYRLQAGTTTETRRLLLVR
ncbi:MAG: carbohydrate binding domain-containing protein [Ignavibacteriae bacterium]|nr:carbohydrate binding domain-containing protein [Ignavibacteriota bacterium]